MRRTLASVAALAASLTSGTTARAEALPSEAWPDASTTARAVDAPYWSRGEPRPFVSASLAIGLPYVRPTFQVGFGRPFYRAMSLDLEPLVTMSGAGFYGGVRATVPFLELRAGVRKFETFGRTLMPPKEQHESADLDLPNGPEAEPVTLESELSGAVAVPGGGPFWLLGVYYATQLEPGHHLYDEYRKVIIAPPWLWRARVGYAWRFGRNDAVRLGVAEEILENPGRAGYVIRAGVLGSVAIGEHADVELSFLPVIHSPDSIGLAGADFAHLGVRWRWATGPATRRRR